MKKTSLSGLLLAATFTASSASLAYAQSDPAGMECDRLISAIEDKAPGEAHDALQKMRVFRDGGQYQACIDTAQAMQGQSPPLTELQVEQALGMDVFNEKDVQIGNVDRLAKGSDQKIYVLMTYRGPRWPGNKRVAIPVDDMRMEDGKLMLPGVGEDDILAMPAVPQDGGVYKPLGNAESVSLRQLVASPNETGSTQRQPSK
jgi:hypothetical protein